MGVVGRGETWDSHPFPVAEIRDCPRFFRGGTPRAERWAWWDEGERGHALHSSGRATQPAGPFACVQSTHPTMYIPHQRNAISMASPSGTTHSPSRIKRTSLPLSLGATLTGFPPAVAVAVGLAASGGSLKISSLRRKRPWRTSIRSVCCLPSRRWMKSPQPSGAV